MTNQIDAQTMGAAESASRFEDARSSYTKYVRDTDNPALRAAFSAILKDLNSVGSFAGLAATAYKSDVATLARICGQ